MQKVRQRELRLHVCPTVSAGLKVTAKLIQLLPQEVIIQVAQDLDTKFIIGAHSTSFSPLWRWRSIKAVATYKNT
jgi:hypothetical protein